MQHLGKILPIDGYQVELNAGLPMDYLDSLIHLYQPLAGMEAIHLYQLLLQETKMHAKHQLQAHHTLMNYVNKSLDYIYQARRKLEGIGLLQTYRDEVDDKVVYTYVLLPPFRPAVFFGDIMLSELLYRQIGEVKFHTLKNHYTDTSIHKKGENITASFNDVFHTFTPEPSLEITPVQEQQQVGIPIESVDFSLLGQVLVKSMIPIEKVLTEMNRRIINQLAIMYGLELYEIEKALLWALTDENELDIGQFKAACQDVFANKENIVQVKLTEKAPKQVEYSPKKNATKTEELIQHFERISPKELLEDMSQGGNASESELEFISDISTRQGLPIPVLNVAIHYVMLQSNQQLSKRYLETIVSNWSRLGYKTAKQAMDHVLNMNKENQSTTKKRRYSQAKQSNEIIPDWFKDRKGQKQEKDQTVEKQKESTMDQKEREELEALLQRHASKNN